MTRPLGTVFENLPQIPSGVLDFRPLISSFSIDPVRHGPTPSFLTRQRPRDDGVPTTVVRKFRNFVGYSLRPPLRPGNARGEDEQVESGESGFEVEESLDFLSDGVPRRGW